MYWRTELQVLRTSSQAHQRQVSQYTRINTHFTLSICRIVVVLENRTYIYNFDDLRLIDAIETCPNHKGLVALNPDPDNAVLATPDQQRGWVRVNVYEKSKSLKIPAHQSTLSALCLNYAGTLLATASDKGTLIRIFSTDTGKPL